MNKEAEKWMSGGRLTEAVRPCGLPARSDSEPLWKP